MYSLGIKADWKPDFGHKMPEESPDDNKNAHKCAKECFAIYRPGPNYVDGVRTCVLGCCKKYGIKRENCKWDDICTAFSWNNSEFYYKIC